MKLWDHQERGRAKIWSAMHAGEDRILLTAATGMGKRRSRSFFARPHKSPIRIRATSYRQQEAERKLDGLGVV